MNIDFFFFKLYIFLEDFIPAKIKSPLITENEAILPSPQLKYPKTLFKYQILKNIHISTQQ